MNPIYKFFLNKSTSNELAPMLMSKRMRLNTSNGQLVVSANHQTSMFMAVTPEFEYIFRDSTGQPTTISYYAFYNQNKGYLSGGTGGTGAPITAPANAAYVRISFSNSFEPANYAFVRSNMSYTAYVSQQAFPVYRDDLAKEFSKYANEQFFRVELSGNLTFESHDYDFINDQHFDFRFVLDVYISYDAGQTWESYFTGEFWKTDCKFNIYDKTVEVRPAVIDQYTTLLPVLERQLNIIELAPAMRRVIMDKPPVLQLYNAGDNVISCLLPGRVWDVECEPVKATETVGGVNKLTDYLHFAPLGNIRTVQLTGDFTPPILRTYSGPVPQGNPPVFAYHNGSFTFECTAQESGGGYVYTYRIWWEQNLMWENTANSPVMAIDLNPVAGTSATGIIHATFTDTTGLGIYARILTDATELAQQPTFDLPSDDMVKGRRTHSHVYPYTRTESFDIGQYYTTTPTKYGMYDDTRYYDAPPGDGFLPIVRNKWGDDSYWFKFMSDDILLFTNLTVQVQTYFNYTVGSVIRKILTTVCPEITAVSSRFLGDTNNPITGEPNMYLLMSPKSDVMTAGSMDYPAQKAEISLREIFDMLRDCFRCYWYVDESGVLWIEHIKYFMNGSYSDTPELGDDLTQLRVRRTGKTLSFGQGQFQFDKPAMAARYTFGWMDDVTEPFNGEPIEIVSNYVDKSNVEDIQVAKFTSDLDYILVGDDVSKDGFALLNSIVTGTTIDDVPYWNDLQNGYLSFAYLQNFYAYDMPAKYYKIGNVAKVALGVKKLKLQTLNFPALRDPNLYKIIRTEIGDGMIEKLSVNLSSRNAKATLKYDTE